MKSQIKKQKADGRLDNVQCNAKNCISLASYAIDGMIRTVEYLE